MMKREKVNPNDVGILSFVNQIIDECEQYKIKWHIGDRQYVKKIEKSMEKRRKRIVELLNKRYNEGTVIDFPCKVGEIMYFVSPATNLILPFRISAISATGLVKKLTLNNSKLYYEVRTCDEFELAFKTYNDAKKYLKSLINRDVKTYKCYEDWLFDRGRNKCQESYMSYTYDWKYGGQNLFTTVEDWKCWAERENPDMLEKLKEE